MSVSTQLDEALLLNSVSRQERACYVIVRNTPQRAMLVLLIHSLHLRDAAVTIHACPSRAGPFPVESIPEANL